MTRLLFALTCLASFCAAQPVEITRISAARAIYVDSLGADAEAQRVRSQLIGKLAASHFTVVNSREQSDVILTGAATVESLAAVTAYYGVAGRVVSLGLSMESRGGRILWGFDSHKCFNPLTQTHPTDQVTCSVSQLAKAVEEDAKKHPKGKP